MLCRYPGHRARADNKLCLSFSSSFRDLPFSHHPPAVRLHLAIVKVGNCRSRLVCAGALKAGATVEEAVERPKTSRNGSNGHSTNDGSPSSGSSSAQQNSSTATAAQGSSSRVPVRAETSAHDRLSPDDLAQQAREGTQCKSLNGSADDAAEVALQSGASGHESIDINSNAFTQQIALEDRQSSSSVASTSTANHLDDTPRKTVRLTRSPGGSVRRADAQDATQQSRPPVGNRVTLDDSDSDEEQSGGAQGQRRTVRLVKGPGGQMVDARKIMGWVAAPDGTRVVCPRCEGQAFIRLGEGGPLQACPVCQQWSGLGTEPDAEPSARQIRRKARAPRRHLSEEHKEKIRQAHAGRKRKPLDEEHKRRIAQSMTRVNSDYEVRQARSEGAMGVPKTCAVCGQPGHNKRTCPQVVGPQGPMKRGSAPHAKPENAPVFKGVTWSASNGQWRAQAWDGKKIQALGHFDDPEEAARAYDVAVLEWRGDRAVTNFPRKDYFGAGVRSIDGDDSSVISAPSAAWVVAELTAQTKRKARPAQDGALPEQAVSAASQESCATAASDFEKAPHRDPDTAGLVHSSAATRDSSIAADMFKEAPTEAAAPAQAGRPNESSTAAQPDISPLIAMEQSSADLSAADLAGSPAEPVLAPDSSAGVPQEGLDLTERMPAGVAPHQEAPKRSSTSRRLRSSAESAGAPPIVFDLPMTRDEAIQGAVEGIRRAWAAGVRRQKVELLLPGDTDGSGYPGGIKQQFGAVRGMVEAILLQLKQLPDFEGRLEAQWLDETDCVGAWESDTMAAVVLATANTLSQLKAMAAAKGGNRLLLVVNPQWQLGGQIVSDFGFGQSRKEAESFVNSFEDVSVTQRLRMMGDDVRLFRCFPGAWQVHFIWPNGRGALLTGIEKERPSYERLLSVLQSVPGSKASRSWVDRVNPFRRLGGGIATKELLAAREEAERRAEMGRARAAGWKAPAQGPPVVSESAVNEASQESSNGASSGLPGSAGRQRQSGQSSADDRFGEWDIITGKRVRDLRLEPVLQLAQWRQSLFGSWESASESLDEDSPDGGRP